MTRCACQILVSLGVLLSVLSSVAEAGNVAWSTRGPEGGTVRVLAVDPNTPTTIYLGAYEPSVTEAAIFKSVDSGQHWTALSLNALFIDFLGVDPSSSSTVYALAEGDCQTAGIVNVCNSELPFKSTDAAPLGTRSPRGCRARLGSWLSIPCIRAICTQQAFSVVSTGALMLVLTGPH